MKTIFAFIVMLFLHTVMLLAQVPPQMPNAPAQAPFGGLSLLALAGGVWAWKKLKAAKEAG